MQLIRADKLMPVLQTLSGGPLGLTTLSETDAVRERLSPLEMVYPGFGRWFAERVEPGTLDGSRRIFTCYERERLMGVVIAKRADERKLCTVWVNKAVRGRGVARKLMLQAMDWLDTGHPLFTVPEERLGEFALLLSAFHFTHSETLISYYRKGRREFVFNGRLCPLREDRSMQATG